jgi:glutamine---fructose-6-phosphate transaminase (isomerizing)
MCGVIGLRCEKDRKDLGEVSSKLLCMLEYRGYDSSGAIIQNEHGDIVLKKDVGAPSVVTKELGINKLHGKIFCGQVRWATFGMVTKENAQPHEVKCKTHLYGAHNGNITNCDQLKVWLSSEGHKVLSDNDGEMLVHTVEHYFAIELSKIKDSNIQTRWEALKNAIVLASKKINGSFAAVVVDPVTETMACIKAGSSLYMGQGKDPVNGSFIIASSDLASN